MTAATTSAARATDIMAAEVRESLRGPVPSLPTKYLYDDRGSHLFEAITRLPEYYQTRTEEALLTAVAKRILASVCPRELIELGSGSGRKTRTFLDRMASPAGGGRCMLVDIDPDSIARAVPQLRCEYPHLEIRGTVADFTQPDFPHHLRRFPRRGRRLALFLGGTIGNLHPDTLPRFLSGMSSALEPGDAFLIGLDLVKDPARLEAAYNDSAGVTAAFNLNILQVVNERLGADFDLSAFEHMAFYDPLHAWIEMRVRVVRPARVRIPVAGLVLSLERGDTIRTELSCKYTHESFTAMLPGTGLHVAAWFTDPEALFALALLQCA